MAQKPSLSVGKRSREDTISYGIADALMALGVDPRKASRYGRLHGSRLSNVNDVVMAFPDTVNSVLDRYGEDLTGEKPLE